MAETSIYISNSAIQAVVGKPGTKSISVKQVYSVRLPEDAVINGAFINEAAVRKALLDLRGVLPKEGVHLLVDGSAVQMRRLNVPILPEKKLIGFIQNELNPPEGEETLIDYMVLNSFDKKSGGGIVLAASVSKQFISSYLAMFASVGVKLKSINLAAAALIRFALQAPTMAGQNFLLTAIDGSSASTLLFVGGEYHFFSRIRLLNEQSSPQFTAELTQMLSSMIQFNKAEKIDYELNTILLSGLSPAAGDVVELCASISETLGVRVLDFPELREVSVTDTLRGQGFRLADFIYPVANLYRKG